MLAVFIDEVPEGCFDYLQQISDILTSLTDYAANNNIRASSAQSLPGLMKSAKSNNADVAMLHNIAKNFTTNLYVAMEKEQDTDTLTVQIHAFKDIIDEAGTGFMNAEEVDHIANRGIELIN